MTTGENKSRSLSQSPGSQSASQQISETRVPVLPLETTMGMAQSQQILFLAGQHSAVLSSRKPYFAVDRLRGRYDPDPFHL
jgi:hypothetical protein